MRCSMLILVAATMPFPAVAQIAQIKPGVIQAIGPKQDDPLTCPAEGAAPGGKGVPIVVQGGRSANAPIVVQGGIEAIGPKQDDPRASGRVARPGDDNDPKAFGGQSTNLAIGPKQDDPRSPGRLARPGDDNDPKAFGGQSTNLAIGPKQDDPRAPGVATRPGDDEDPQALALAGKCAPAR
jgi:hypothetical protein